MRKRDHDKGVLLGNESGERRDNGEIISYGACLHNNSGRRMQDYWREIYVTVV